MDPFVALRELWRKCGRVYSPQSQRVSARQQRFPAKDRSLRKLSVSEPRAYTILIIME